MLSLYHTFFYNPILEALIFVYQNITFQDLGLAIIVLTLLFRLILFPLFYKRDKDQTLFQKIQPQIKKIQKELKDNKEEQVKALMELYKEHKVNPFGSMLLVLIQLPILIAIYQVILKEIGNFDNFTLLGFINLREKSVVLAAIAAILQYYQVKISLPKKNERQEKEKQAFDTASLMIILGPVLTFGILTNFPSALGVYWLASTVFSIIQQFFINKIVYGTNTKENRATG